MSDFSSKRPGSRKTAEERASSPQPALDALLSGTARDPVRHALWLDALDRQLHPLLPPSLAAHARLANVHDGKLVYLVDSPVWHARLRLAANELLDAARSLGLDVADVVVRTTSGPLEPVTQARANPSPAPRAGRSAATEEALRTALASLRDPVADDGSTKDDP